MATPKPDHATMHRIEELLREQLENLGEHPDLLEPHEIARNMLCAVHSSGSLAYSWHGIPIMDVEPEPQAGGSVVWRFFTREMPVQ